MNPICLFILSALIFSFQAVYDSPAGAETDEHFALSPVVPVSSSEIREGGHNEISSVLSEGYILPLRIHLSRSGFSEKMALMVAREINHIWKSQANICFKIEVVGTEEAIAKGLDIWFLKTIPDWNGYFETKHQIFVRDAPVLGEVLFPAQSAAARTAAHEIGHALGLEHRQDSDENLMRSKTFGWQLNKQEINIARENVRSEAGLFDGDECPPPVIRTILYSGP